MFAGQAVAHAVSGAPYTPVPSTVTAWGSFSVTLDIAVPSAGVVGPDGVLRDISVAVPFVICKSCSLDGLEPPPDVAYNVPSGETATLIKPTFGSVLT